MRTNMRLPIVLLMCLAAFQARSQSRSEALFRAVQSGNLEETMQLLELGAPVDAVDAAGYTPLNYACALASSELIHVLFRFGADPNGQGWAEPPLFTAIKHSSHKPVMLLLQAGINPAELDSANGNGVYLAAKHNKAASMRLLLPRGVLTHLPYFGGNSAVHVAAENGSAEALEALLGAGDMGLDDRNDEGQTPLHLAAAAGHADICSQLIKAGADLNAFDHDHRSALHLALINGKEATAIRLLESRILPHIPDKLGNYPIHYAAIAGLASTAQSLAAYGADVNVPDAKGNTPLRLAAEQGRALFCKALVQSGASMPQAGFPAPLMAILKGGTEATTSSDLKKTTANGSFLGFPYLSWAILSSESGIAGRLVELGAEVEARDLNGNTPLHHAAAMDLVDVAELLNSQQVDLNAQNKFGETPLQVALALRRRGMVEWLLKMKARTDLRGKMGATAIFYAIVSGKEYTAMLVAAGANLKEVDARDNWPAHAAVMAGDPEVLRLLLENGSPVNNVNEDGDTALHLAAQMGRDDVLRVLLEKGADVTVKNSAGKTPEQVAIAAWHLELGRLLR